MHDRVEHKADDYRRTSPPDALFYINPRKHVSEKSKCDITNYKRELLKTIKTFQDSRGAWSVLTDTINMDVDIYLYSAKYIIPTVIIQFWPDQNRRLYISIRSKGKPTCGTSTFVCVSFWIFPDVGMIMMQTGMVKQSLNTYRSFEGTDEPHRAQS